MLSQTDRVDNGQKRIENVEGALGFGTTGGAATGGDATPLAAGAGCSCGQGWLAMAEW